MKISGSRAKIFLGNINMKTIKLVSNKFWENTDLFNFIKHNKVRACALFQICFYNITEKMDMRIEKVLNLIDKTRSYFWISKTKLRLNSL